VGEVMGMMFLVFAAMFLNTLEKFELFGVYEGLCLAWDG